MTLLSKVDNDNINDNLEKRYFNGDIYTYIGHVLISVNPFRDLGLYTDDILKSYTGKNRLEVPPHVFAIAESSYYNMVSYKENQCVIISGESGAGKTEIMHYIATVSSGQSKNIQHTKEMVLATNPLLESFGCAKTLRNNNSSRHGKYLELQFNTQGEPIGAFITNYLLEKNRVVNQIKNERNFHIFYQYCRGASQEYKDMFGISGPENFWYTNQSQCLQVDGIDDVKDYHDTLESMNVIGLSQDEQIGIHRVLALILWVGNVQFTEADNNSSFVTDADVTDFIAYLLEADSAKLEKTLISRVVETKRGGRRGSVYEVPLNPDQAVSVRDALAKAFYDRLFEWIIERINIALKQGSGYDYTIGVLDIYGFEIFDHNSFEQLCINYVNEKLQQIFIELTLKAEQEEYVKEQIQWTPIKFFNNKIVCDLIEEKRPPGIFAAMNDAVATAHADPSAADNSFVQKLSVCSSNPHLEQRGNQFIIKHYAGDVSYNVQGMTDKNKDQLSKDILELCQSSENAFIRNLFPDQVDQDSKRRPPTASDRIKSSAGALLHSLYKPNQTKSHKDYDQKMSLHQIKYLGLCENIRVRRAGFAYRQTFEKFVERFFLLSKRTGYAGEYIWRGDAKQGTKAILEDINIPKEEWQLDKYWHTMATRIQRAWRAFLQYRHDCATKIQRCFRKNKDQMEYAKVRDLGHSLLGQRKERRRMSLISMRRFSGDYLGLNLKKTGEAMRNICSISDKDTVFSFKVEVLMPRPLRSSKPLPRILVMTKDCLYILATVVEKKAAQLKVERKLSITMLTGVSLSNLQDDWMVLHVRDDIDIVLICPFKTEFATHLNRVTNSRITINQGTIKFQKDENAPKDGVYKSHTVSIGTGSPATSLSNPPCARNEPVRTTRPSTTKAKPAAKPTPKPVANTIASVPVSHTPPAASRAPPPPPPAAPVAPPKDMYKALYDFAASSDGEFTFNAGDIFEIVQKEDNGWWLAKKDGKEAWVPSNYLEEVKVAAPPPPPPVAPRASIPVPAAKPQPVAAPVFTEEAAPKPFRLPVQEKQPEPEPEPEPEVPQQRLVPPKPVPTKKPAFSNSASPVSDSSANDNIPAWKRELQAMKQARANGGSPLSRNESESSGQTSPVPAAKPLPGQRPVPGAKPGVPPKPAIPSKPSSLTSSHNNSPRSSVGPAAGGIGGLANALNSRFSQTGGIPRPGQSPYATDDSGASSPVPQIPSRPGSGAGGPTPPQVPGKPRMPPRPPVPNRN
ncbi:hypothetical protein CONCODRAFT_82259 [Conidiobolus coronatus NRRL 28638]|uniref:Myosin-1 n=1 Tax=Conidiobolus coronatus (strain ATCC 28846 / CBS 209.66 / NRRL 28638) TaxID=796925 RepID=A0A137NXW3_CONC2|nr:hypothetical protein CONCODRAFT_82259 [Conidiobolus coronatus NRRL 28638]|eukprot:KXN67518.1 hypothetical protein CONCODRAFT_82259 [Conidiobolus coronatus NRRL 28638]